MTGAEWKIDAVAASASLAHTFDDTSGCGFDNLCVGTLSTVGSATYGVTITSAGAPPTFYWNASTGAYVNDLTYTTIEYFETQFRAHTADVQFTNVTLQNANGTPTLLLLDSSPNWTNVTINANNKARCMKIYQDTRSSITNLVLQNSATWDIDLNGYALELVDSNFDITKVTSAVTTDSLISKDHNDVSNSWYFRAGITASVIKSDITNDFVSTDNVTIYTGTLTADEALAHTDMTIKTGGTLTVNQNLTHTITHTTGRITIESGGTLNWNGSSGNTISLVSSSQGTQWEVDSDSGGTVNASWCLVRDSDATSGELIDGTDNCTDVDNNDGWDFGGVTQYKDTISGFARIKGQIKDIISGLARIKGVNIKDTLSGLARIKEVDIKDIISGNARVREQIKDVISGEARILGEIKDTISGYARIVIAGVVKDTISGLARIKGTSIKDVISGLARIKEINIKDTISGNSRILEQIKDVISGETRILGTVKDIISGNSRIKDTNIKDIISGGARVKGESIKDTVSGLARIKEVSIKDTISGGARILEVIKDSISGLARIKGIDIKNIVSGYAKIVTFSINRNVMNGYAHIVVDVRGEFEYLTAVDGQIYMEAI